MLVEATFISVERLFILSVSGSFIFSSCFRGFFCHNSRCDSFCSSFWTSLSFWGLYHTVGTCLNSCFFVSEICLWSLFNWQERIVELFEKNTYSVVNIFDVTLRPQLNVTGVVEVCSMLLVLVASSKRAYNSLDFLKHGKLLLRLGYYLFPKKSFWFLKLLTNLLVWKFIKFLQINNFLEASAVLNMRICMEFAINSFFILFEI